MYIFLLVIGLLNYVPVQSQSNPNPSDVIDGLLTDEMSAEHFPGLSTVIVKGDRIVWMNSYGYADIANAIPVTDTTAFMLASVSKVFTGTAAMQMAEGGGIDLDDSVNQYLPWTLQIPGFPTDPVTFRQLMTHTSSIRDNWIAMNGYYGYPDPDISLADCMERYFSASGSDYDATANFFPNSPGSVYAYSNMATALNGYLVERIGDMPFDQYCETHIFNVLCMGNTSWFFADFDSNDVARPYRYAGGTYIPYAHYGFADYPDGQLRSNVTDLANFMIAYLNGGTFGFNVLLTPASINQMWTPQIPELNPQQGLNWYREYLVHDGGISWVWGHSGGSEGVTTDMYLDPENKIGICVLANGEGSGLQICDALYNYALTLDASSGVTPGCITTLISDGLYPAASAKKLIKIVDVLGRETQPEPNRVLLKIYSDGSVEKVMIIH